MLEFSHGIDAVEISRFASWHNYSRKSLKKIFTDTELDYAFSVKTKTAERLAVRFAAKEAAYKALSKFLLKPISFISIAKFIEIQKDQISEAPILNINWSKLPIDLSKKYSASLSCTHTKTLAISSVFISVN